MAVVIVVRQSDSTVTPCIHRTCTDCRHRAVKKINNAGFIRSLRTAMHHPISSLDFARTHLRPRLYY